MQDKLTLMIPGPTPVPESVLKAMGRHPIGHRSGEFQAVGAGHLHPTLAEFAVVAA